MSDWQPIEKAPKDGKEFLACNTRQGSIMQLVYWNKVHRIFMTKGEHIPGFIYNSTHWQPLPDPPVSSSTKSKEEM